MCRPNVATAAALSAQSSRRRRLWELDGHAHCPVVGVCLPIDAMRRLLNKTLGGTAIANDYELHCGIVTESKRRAPIAEAVQGELDRRYRVLVRQAAAQKTTEALAAWWRSMSGGEHLAGAFWATLTHPRCLPALEHQVVGEVHMLQHQVGIARRVEHARLHALQAELAATQRELTQAQQRHQRLGAEHEQHDRQQQAQIVQLRAQLQTRDAELAAVQAAQQALQDQVPDLHSRVALTAELAQCREQLLATERELQRARTEAQDQRRRADDAIVRAAQQAADRTQAAMLGADTATPPDATALPVLVDRSVLCVGGRAASVPLYRRLIEDTGGRFLHHDGGGEDNVAKLDATLAAADLVICQTGCISHDAYWRVKHHCKRTGKRCVFVENPSATQLKRALAELQPDPA